MRILMVGVHKSTKGGMWTVVENYLQNTNFINKYNIKYISTAVSGSAIKRLLYSFCGVIKVLFYTLFNNYDIIHVHMSERMSVFRKGIIINISQIRKCKVIIHMHGAEFELWYNSLNYRKKNKVRKILNSSTKILILGNYWREFVSSLVDDKSKIEVLYNAVICPNKNLYNLKSNKLLFLGAISKRKGIYDLLKAMNILKNKEVKTKLLLYGPDTTYGINDLISKNKLEDYIEYKGWLNSSDRQKLFSEEIAINILPSYNEGLPMTILETMSYGIPNISTNIAAIPEVLNVENGYINNPGDYKKIARDIMNILQHDDLRKKFSNNSYNTINKFFSIDSHIDKLSKIYDEVR